jgi:hypothetical protein
MSDGNGSDSRVVGFSAAFPRLARYARTIAAIGGRDGCKQQHNTNQQRGPVAARDLPVSAIAVLTSSATAAQVPARLVQHGFHIPPGGRHLRHLSRQIV